MYLIIIAMSFDGLYVCPNSPLRWHICSPGRCNDSALMYMQWQRMRTAIASLPTIGTMSSYVLNAVVLFDEPFFFHLRHRKKKEDFLSSLMVGLSATGPVILWPEQRKQSQ